MANEKRLIDANLLLEWVERLETYNMGRRSCLQKPKGLTPEGVRHMIDTIPKVDAVEVVHGRWEKDEPDKRGNRKPRCSVCGEYHLAWWSDYTHCNYCPNCGAKMDGGNENDS